MHIFLCRFNDIIKFCVSIGAHRALCAPGMVKMQLFPVMDKSEAPQFLISGAQWHMSEFFSRHDAWWLLLELWWLFIGIVSSNSFIDFVWFMSPQFLCG